MTFNEVFLLVIGGGAFVFMMFMFIRVIFMPTPVDPEAEKKKASEVKPAVKSKAKA